MGLSAPPISLIWAYQQRYSANTGLSTALLSQHGPVSGATQPNMALSAAPFNLTWANQQLQSA